MAASTILDPRFKDIHFEDPAAASSIIAQLQAEILTEQGSPKGTSESDTESTDPSFDLWAHRKSLVHLFNSSGKNSPKDGLSLYLKMPVSELKSNPLEVWETLKEVYPSLYPIARKYLALVATSVPAERLFSKAGNIQNLRRYRLLTKRLNKLLFLNSSQC